MKQTMAGMLAGLASVLVVMPAVAAPVTYTIWGTVLGGSDMSGQFGGGSLADKAFKAIETFDPAQAQSSWSTPTGSGANGDVSRTGKHFATVALTIGSFTRTFSDRISSLDSAAGRQFDSNVKNGADDIGFAIASPRILADYTAGNAILDLAARYAGSYTLTDASGDQVLWSNFEVDGLTVVNAVPLPAAAPLFGAGLVALAALGVRRRRVVTAVAAG